MTVETNHKIAALVSTLGAYPDLQLLINDEVTKYARHETTFEGLSPTTQAILNLAGNN